jgi:hypothetical protein
LDEKSLEEAEKENTQSRERKKELGRLLVKKIQESNDFRVSFLCWAI